MSDNETKLIKLSRKNLEKMLRNIRREIDFYEEQRKELSGMYNKPEKREYNDKKLRELWTGYWSIYRHLKNRQKNKKSLRQT